VTKLEYCTIWHIKLNLRLYEREREKKKRFGWIHTELFFSSSITSSISSNFDCLFVLLLV